MGIRRCKTWVKEFMFEVLRQAPFACAYQKLLINDQGQPGDYIFLDINPAFEDMTSLIRKTIIGKRVTEILPKSINSNFDWVSFYGKVALNGKIGAMTQCATPRGQCYKITAYALQKGYYITVFQDITDEKRQTKALEEKMQQSKELSKELEMAFNGAHEAISLIRVEKDSLRYIKNNAAHQRLTGISLAELIGKTPIELEGKDIGKTVRDNYQRCIDTKASITYEESRSFPTGEKICLTSLTPIIEKGKVKCVLVSSNDITLRKKEEEERTEIYQQQQAMFRDHNAVMLLIEPLTGKIIDANLAACEFYGYTRDEILAMHIQDITILSQGEVDEWYLLAL